MQGGKDQYRSHAQQDQNDCQRVSQRELAGPQQKTTTYQTDQDADDVDGAHAVHQMRNDMDEEYAGEEAGEVVVPLHGVPSCTDVRRHQNCRPRCGFGARRHLASCM
jgi:hypothetical protein